MEPYYSDQARYVNMLEVFRARSVIYRDIQRTLLHEYSRLSEELGARVFVKHENHLPTHSFKVRGAVNFMARAPREVLENGIVVATRGNHGLAVAWAAQKRGILCNVVVPEGNDPEVNDLIRAYGAQLIEHGADFYEAQDYCEELAENAGYYYLRQGNEPLLLTGIATMGLEIFEDLPEVDTIIMPIGGGTGCAALGLVIKHINPDVELIGVQAEKMPAFYESWKKGKRVTVPRSDTVAAGLAARSVFELPFTILRDTIRDVVLLSERELMDGVRLALRYTQNLAEVAGAASLACAFKIRNRLKGKKVVLVMTGSNISSQLVARILAG
ncbi:threonine ammonia-lyase [Thermodesulforhabdus norvegica]|uniref:Threonine dehydratase n=1 Tax=Thermodesulforhabdus norvegica TaxID=39841 RepID=A0A1I4QHH8_9BACT|nr:threonine/serine dehydratase [Thermodesulforhabdus norvegica]SFM39474.1 threonine dehydratase [Thermodesulforhabdus norvegica]